MTDASSKKVVIIGAGQAAAQACASLRQYGHEGEITVIGDEAALPYQRPPLSKAYMKGELAEERLYFRPAQWYADKNVNLLTGTRADRIDREKFTVHLSNGDDRIYDALIVATGSRPRALLTPGANLAGVFDLRSLADVERIKPYLVPGKKLVIIGAGYIGLEAAAVARQSGLDVVVVEMAERVLARVAGPAISDFYAHIHEEEGVRILTNTRLSHMEGDGSVESVVLADGNSLSADFVLVGIGIVPNDELAKEAGLKCDNGIVTDLDARTSDPAIFAAGDCAARPLVHYDRIGRLESVHNAIEQGKLAAAAIMGQERPKEDCPWFWSDQYDVKLQIAGLSHGYDDFVIRGYVNARKFSVAYLKDGRLIALDAINSPADFMMAKKLIMARAVVSPDMLSDTTVSMKEIVASVTQTSA